MAAAALAALSVGGLAVAAGLDIRKDVVQVDDAGQAKARAKCKQGDRAIAGGYFINDENIALPRASQNFGKDEWRTTITEYETPNPDETLTGFAYCGDLKVKTKTGTTSVPPKGVTSVKAKCPKGQTAVSGGFRAPNEFTHPFVSKRAGKRAWKVKAINYDDAETFLRAFARCAARKPLGVEREAEQLEYDGSGVDEPRIEASCGSGERVVSGGFKSSLPVTDFGPFFTAAYRKGTKAWEVRTGFFVVEPVITSYAYCQG